MCSCHSILECCVTFSGVKLSIRSFVLFIYLTSVNFFSSSSDSIRLSMRFIGWVLRRLRSFVPANKTICNESPAFLLTKLRARLTQPSRLSPGFVSLIPGTLPTFIFLGFILCNMESPTNIIFSVL